MRRAPLRTASCAALVAGVLLCLAERPARADDAAARLHFRQGVELYDRKQYARALEQFEIAYREKPSPGIKQNIALCLKGLGRLPEAASALDEALELGQTTLAPEVRAAIERELVELAARVATVNLEVVFDDGRPAMGASVSIDGVALDPAALHRPIRLAPGVHVFRAHLEGAADPPEKKLGCVAGAPVDARFVLPLVAGLVTIRPSVVGAVVRIDGLEVGRGAWTGTLPVGPHRVSVSAPDFQETSVDISVVPGGSLDQPVTLRRPPEPPAPYVAFSPPPAAKIRRGYIVPMLGLSATSYRLTSVLDEPLDGTTRKFGGGALGLRGGYLVKRWFGIELALGVGSLSVDYTLTPDAPLESKTTVKYWSVAPALRFVTPGRVRFTSGAALGLRRTTLEATLAEPGAMVAKAGAGTGLSLLLDLGLQVDAGPVFFEVSFFAEGHGVAAVRDDASGNRLLGDSPATRIGLTVGLGIPVL